jgi:hypothetical protein
MSTYTVEGLTAQDVDLIALALDAYTSSLNSSDTEEYEAHSALLFKFDNLTDPVVSTQAEPGTVTARDGNVIRVSFGR